MGVEIADDFVRNVAPEPSPDDEQERGYSFTPGGVFVLDAPLLPPAIWGRGGEVLWAEGESLMPTGPVGAGKTTLAGQLAAARLGVLDKVLGFEVTPGDGNVLYLAMDRPSQIRRSLRRLFGDQHRGLLDDKLKVWSGPPPLDMARYTGLLTEIANDAGADTVVIDSLKDAAIGLTDDEVGAGYNRARQTALRAGIQLLELHHQIKRGPGGGIPDALADVYGSTWLAAGAGSVVLLWGAAGDPIVQLKHLKQPAEEVGPLLIRHDHDTGLSEVWHATDLFAIASSRREGLTAKAATRVLFSTDQPTSAQVERARRKLDKLVASGLLCRRGGAAGGNDKTPATWHAATVSDLRGEGQ
jgi:AAA domain